MLSPIRARRPVALAVLLAVLAAGCAPAIERPRSGALPGTEYPTPTAGVPPTLTTASDPRFRGLPSPSPGLAASPSAVPSPVAAGRPPIVLGLAPANGGAVGAGAPVAVSAGLVGRENDLAAASLFVDGAEVPASVERADPRRWTIRATLPLAAGQHSARVLVEDAARVRAGFTWRFYVGTPPPPATPKPAATPAATTAPEQEPAPPAAEEPTPGPAAPPAPAAQPTPPPARPAPTRPPRPQDG